jgi:Holliday junction resolvase RusA-like endonuclease
MANPFINFTPEMVAAHNAKVSSGARAKAAADSAEPEMRAPVQYSNNERRMQFSVNIEPCPAPRMTRRDKWLKPRRPCVQKYFDYRERVQRAVGDIPEVPDELHCVFYVSMPESWSKKKRQEMDRTPHRTRPDRDNYDKAVCDALFLEDGGVWKGSQEKRWAIKGRVEITMVWR